jgi:murein DD-endopeptidase MepM/ murein hydrolase activator NlpD
LQQGSISVTVGHKVTSGQALASVGNPGDSSEPHLHLQLTNAANTDDATGTRMRYDRLLPNKESSVLNHAPIRTNLLSGRLSSPAGGQRIRYPGLAGRTPFSMPRASAYAARRQPASRLLQ